MLLTVIESKSFIYIHMHVEDPKAFTQDWMRFSHNFGFGKPICLRLPENIIVKGRWMDWPDCIVKLKKNEVKTLTLCKSC